ncbi:MAG: tetratricopeptide repeat protein [Ignavibacteriales bacterium]|nr:tetratricopeptide repeat protein [Ignavibacteriales bacterium]
MSSKKNRKIKRGKLLNKKFGEIKYFPFNWKEIFHSRWFLPLLSLFFLIIIFSLRPLSDIDLGFHLAGGKWILENGAFHNLDQFTYTVNQNEYIALHWLFQVIIYPIFTFLGYNALLILKIILILILFLLIYKRMMFFRVPTWLSFIVLFLLILCFEIRFVLRPELSTYIFILLTLIILDKYYYQQKNHLFFLPIIQIFWINLHGLFIIGWLIIGAYFLSIWFHRKTFDRQLFKWFIFSMLATLINPYFLDGTLFPFYLQTRLQSSNIFNFFISELKSPWSISATENAPFFPVISLYLYYIFSFLSFLLALLTIKRRRLHDILLLILFFYLSYTAIRNVPIFLLIAVHIIYISIIDLLPRLDTILNKIKQKNILNKFLPIGAILLIIFLSLRIINNAYYSSDRRMEKFGLGVNYYSRPEGASKFILDNNLKARILNDLNSGSWLIWRVGQPVFIDGRLEVIQEGFFEEYRKSFDENGLKHLINRYKPKIIVFDYSALLSWCLQLNKMNDWDLVYWDEYSAIYKHSNYATNLNKINLNDALKKKHINLSVSNEEVWKLLHKPLKSAVSVWFTGFFESQMYPSEIMKMGIFAYQNNEFRVAELLYLQFLKDTNGYYYEVFFNLGSLYFRMNDFQKSLYCYEKYLSKEPANQLAQERVSILRNKINSN